MLEKTDEIIAKRDKLALERQQTSITAIVSVVNTVKDTFEETKITRGESEKEIAAWSREIEGELEKADEITRQIQNRIRAIDLEQQGKQAEEEHRKRMEFKRELLGQKVAFENHLEEEKTAAKEAKQQEGKAYVLLYVCSLTRGVYLDLLPNLEKTECLTSLKRFIARRGRPERIYSDNGRTFIGAAKWMRAVLKVERLQNYLSTNQIRWQFHLSVPHGGVDSSRG